MTHHRKVARTIGCVSATTSDTESPPAEGIRAPALDARLRGLVRRRLLARGLPHHAAETKACAYVRAFRVLEEMDLMSGRDIMRHYRAHEVAQRTVFEIAAEAGLSDRDVVPTPSGPRPSLSRVKPTPSTASPRSCEADALDDASAEGPTEAVRNTPDEWPDRAGTQET